MWRLRCGKRDAGKSGADGFEQIGEVVAKRLCTDCNCEGNEHDQHGVFGSGGAALFTTKATDQTLHLNFLSFRGDPVSSARAMRSQSPRSQCPDSPSRRPWPVT